jgi:hypothetical protein
MSNAKRLSEKDPGETIVLCWDFSAELPADDPDAEITGTGIVIVVDTSLRRGADPLVDDMLLGLPEIVDKQVLQALTAGVDQVDYKVRCAVDLASVPVTRIYKSSIVPVRAQ